MISITDVRVYKYPEVKGKAVGKASIVIDGSFVVNDLVIVNGKDGLFVAMPNRKNPGKDVYHDIAHPTTTECRELITKAVLDKFNEAEVATVPEEETIAVSAVEV